MRIAFLPTGLTEWHGLPGAFRALFPGGRHEFDVLPDAMEIKSFPDKYPYPGFTSNPLTARHEAELPGAALDLVKRAAQEALGDKHRQPADLVIVLDDLEPANMHQPDLVASVFRAAVLQHVKGLQSNSVREKTQERLRERVSFHLLVPMVEALFFADESMLRAVGMPDNAVVAFPSDRDPEDFETMDAAYLAATDETCPCWKELGIPPARKKKFRPKWLGLPSWWQLDSNDRERMVSWRKGHPKGYLQWLCRDGNQKNCTTYDETDKGGKALSTIPWRALLARADHHFKYLRALIADVADTLGEDPVTGKLTGAIADLTNPLRKRPQRVLRNL